MGLQSAMTTALTGLQAAETTIDVVGNNVANSNTVGFKESQVRFATQFLQTQSIGSAPSEARGGTNPRQIGLGVKVAEITPDFNQGTVEISSNPLDLAIQGDGFLIVQGAQGEQLYTRNGQLKANASNQVVTITGQRVLGINMKPDGTIDGSVNNPQPIVIPLGETAIAKETENVFMSGTLTPIAEVGDTPEIIESAVLGNAEIEAPDDSGFGVDDFAVIGDTVDVSGVSTSAASGGAPPAGDYDYRFVFVDGAGNESTPSNVFSATQSGTGLDFTGLPAIPVGFTGINAYRRPDGGTGDFELVNTGGPFTTGFTDDVADASLGQSLNTGTVDEAAYSYYVTFVDEDGIQPETRPSRQIGTISISQPGRRIQIKDIPQPAGGASSAYDSVRIYRNTKDEPGVFYEVADVPVGQTTFIDNRPDSEITDPENIIDLNGPKIEAGTRLLDVQLRDGSNYNRIFEEGTLSFAGVKGSRTLETKSFEIDSSTTVTDLIAFMDEAFGVDTQSLDPNNPIPGSPGGSVVDGKIKFTSNMGIENALDVALTSFQLKPTDGETTSVLIPFSTSQEANGAGSTTDFVVYDSLGIPVRVRVTTVLEESNSNNTVYRWHATSADNEPDTTYDADTVVGNGRIVFDSRGNIVSGSIGEIAVQRRETASASPLEVNLNFGQVSGLAQTNNLNESNSVLSVTSQDGFPPGILTSFIIGEGGEIRGVFSNGSERLLGQVVMARFANPSGLQQTGENLYAQAVNSGEPINGTPGDRGIGFLTAGAVELSNTDIGENLIELILASTQYRGGARVITAAQEMLDELMALRR